MALLSISIAGRERERERQLETEEKTTLDFVAAKIYLGFGGDTENICCSKSSKNHLVILVFEPTKKRTKFPAKKMTMLKLQSYFTSLKKVSEMSLEKVFISSLEELRRQRKKPFFS